MKKTFALILIFVLIASAIGCGKDNAEQVTEPI